MADNEFQQLWIQRDVNNLAATRAMEAIEQTGRALPCRVTEVHGSIVTVAFEVSGPWTLQPLTLPKAESQWMRAPTQVGDFGITMPADTYLGGVSGLGGGVADLTVDYGNMTALVWVPIGSTTFAAPPNPNQAWVNGPEGAVISDTEQTVMLIVDKATGTIQMAGSGEAANDGLVRKSDLQAMADAIMQVVHTWGAANFNSGTSSPPVPAAPTATASGKTFSA